MEHNVFLVELNYKGDLIRYALTEDDFKKEYPQVDIEKIRNGDSETIKPLVHIWVKKTNSHSEEWVRFFSDMSYGLAESDIENGNLAYIDLNYCSVCFREDIAKVMAA